MNNSNKIIFYFDPMSRAQVIYRMLEEVNADYDIKYTHLKKNEQKTPEFLKINPMGKLPVITHKGTHISEVAAICLYLADIFPEANLAPAINDPKRGEYYRWMFFATNCLEPAVMDHNFPRRTTLPDTSLGYGSFQTTIKTLEDAVKDHFLLGNQFTTADLYISSYLEWFFFQKSIPENEILEAYVKRCMDRPRTRIYQEKRKMGF